MQLREDRHAFQVHRGCPAEVEESAAAALRSHDLSVIEWKRENQSENEGGNDEKKGGVALVDVLLAPGILMVSKEQRRYERGACCECT